jgi:23S rRNA pseudoU1915 N3-methylase RlmH
MEFRKRRVEAAEAEVKRQKEAQAAADKQRHCTNAKNNLAALERGGRVTRTDASGEQVFLSDAEMAAELPNARQTADSWCK